MSEPRGEKPRRRTSPYPRRRRRVLRQRSGTSMPELYSPGAIKAMERRRTMLRTAFGTSIAEALDDPAVIEVMVNPDGRLWLDKAGQGRIDTGEHIGWSEAERVIR